MKKKVIFKYLYFKIAIIFDDSFFRINSHANILRDHEIILTVFYFFVILNLSKKNFLSIKKFYINFYSKILKILNQNSS